MSVLVVGMSHKSAPIDVLERAALDVDAAVKLSHRVLETEFVSESVVISTCNRVEIYVEAERFHGAVEEVSRLLADHSGLDRDDFVRHVESLHSAQAESTVGSCLNALFQQALRIGKRGHAETGIDRLAPSIVTAGLDAAGPVIDADGTRFLVAGAGTMASLAVRTLVDRGVDPHRIMVANRTYQRAYALVATFGVSAVRWQAMDLELTAADVLISCTGAAGAVFDRERIAAALDGRPMVLIDLALPRDIDPDVRELDGVDLVDLAVLSELSANAALAGDVKQVQSIVEAEVRTFLAAKAASHITPTVIALRTMATDIVAAEQARIESRLPNLTAEERADVRKALHRVAEKLIHAPTVRVQQLIDGPADLTYADALADLFALDQSAVDAVTRAGDKA
jgi:glutamyl-tRNA reductase